MHAADFTKVEPLASFEVTLRYCNLKMEGQLHTHQLAVFLLLCRCFNAGNICHSPLWFACSYRNYCGVAGKHKQLLMQEKIVSDAGVLGQEGGDTAQNVYLLTLG